MTGLLRFLGVLNVAVWLGATVFCAAGVRSAAHSRAMLELTGARYFDYFSVEVEQLLFTRLYHWQTGCAVIAGLHLFAEWLYLGRRFHRGRILLLMSLLALSLMGGLWLSPRLASLHRVQHALDARADDRETARRSFHRWEGVFQAVNLSMIGGVAVYFWQLTRMESPPRFVGSVNFRG